MGDSRFVDKSILAPIFIALGCAVSLTLGQPLGAIFFAFGLLSVCVFKANLFTGKVGYWWRPKFLLALCFVLIINLVIGYGMGILISLTNNSLTTVALSKVLSWDFSGVFFVKSVFCGMIMYICVEMFRKGEKLGIFFGVPLFIYCDFQHCIANIIYLGIANTWSWTIILAIVGNAIGSLFINLLDMGWQYNE